MKILNLEQGSQAWFDKKLGKVSGSRVGDVWSTQSYTKDDIKNILNKFNVEYDPKSTVSQLKLLLTNDYKLELMKLAEWKIGFYQLLAERLAVEKLPEDPSHETAADRGLRLEPKAIKRFEDDTKKIVERPGIWVSDISDDIIISPDGGIKNLKGLYTEAVEAKCLSSARHLQAVIEKKIPPEFHAQKIQYFVVNDDLETLYHVFFDDRIKNKALQIGIIETKRKDVEKEVKMFKMFELMVIKEIQKLVGQYGF